MKRLSIIVLLLAVSTASLSAGPFKAETAIYLEPVMPGIVFFNQDRPVAGSLMLAGRLLTLGATVHFHNRYADYASAEKAARIADLYYGPGLQYRDPYSGGYKSTAEFRKEADRNLNLSSYAAGTHLLLLGIGIYNGIIFASEEQIKQAPVYDAAQAINYERLQRIIPAGRQEGRLFEILILLDF